MESIHDKQIMLYSEISASCTNNCRICPMGRAKRNSSFIKNEVRDRIINFISDNSKLNFKVFLHLIGEPLLYDRLEEYIKLLNVPNCELWLCTNGSLLNNDRLERLCNAGLKNLWYSFFDTNEKDYQKNTHSNNFWGVKKNLSNLIAKSDRFDNVHIVTFSKDITGLPAGIKSKKNITIEKTRKVVPWNSPIYYPLYRLFNFLFFRKQEKHICVSVDGEISLNWRDYNFKNSIGNICDLSDELILDKYFNFFTPYFKTLKQILIQ